MYSNSDQEELQIYQQDQVIWAKIRGFPWWPAFVGKVHVHPKTTQAEYTVYFFGDNSHAKLGSLKLRKFIDFYTEFYPKAKTNRKLWQSVQKAEQKLAENNQDIKIFEDMRSQMKKRARNAPLQHKNSVQSEPVKQREEGKLALTKSKTNNFKMHQKQQLHYEQQKQKSQEVESSRVIKYRQRGTLSTNQVDAQIEVKVQKPTNINQNEHIVNSQSKSKFDFSNHVFHSQNLEEEHKQEAKSQSDSENQQSGEEVLTDKAKQSKKIHKINVKDRRVGSYTPRKRGRPRKNLITQLLPKHHTFKTRGVYKIKRKISVRHVSSQRQQLNLQLQPISDAEILQKIPDLLDNRSQLIDFLLRVNITHLNAKQILDLNVADVLQNGKSNLKVERIIELLESALLYRYFPGDLKNKKRYFKLIRKRGTNIENLKVERSEDNNFLKDIRKKTIVKLQKFLRGYGETNKNAKEAAVKIEEYFYKTDNLVQQRYRKIAYKILSSLKQKKEQIAELLRRLEKNIDDV